MIKGVNRRIVEVIFPESAYFEKAVVFLRTDCLPVSGAKLGREAKADLSELEAEITRGAERSAMRIGMLAGTILRLASRLAVIIFAVCAVVRMGILQ